MTAIIESDFVQSLGNQAALAIWSCLPIIIAIFAVAQALRMVLGRFRAIFSEASAVGAEAGFHSTSPGRFTRPL
jgi:hypothetical protein